MTAIWQKNGSGWHLLVPAGFPNEATIHILVEELTAAYKEATNRIIEV